MFYRIIIFLILILMFKPPKHMYNYVDDNSPCWMASDIAANSEETDSTLTVVSFNIKFATRLDAAYEELMAEPLHQADIILLQEMDEEGTIYLSERLGYNYLYYPICIHHKNSKNFGNAILSRWPIQQPEKIMLPHAQPFRKNRRGATAAVIQYGEIDIQVYSIHLETPMMSRSKRIAQLQSTLNNINTVDHTDFVIAGGDFNSLFPKDVRQMVDLCRIHDLEWNTADVGHTLRRFKLIKPTLDHIFSRGFELIDAGKLDNWNASDHAPIWASLRVI